MIEIDNNENDFNKIYLDNQKLIKSIVNKYTNYNYIKDDLIQEANIALLEAYKTYDSSNSSNAKFETYATTLIYNAINNFIRKEKKYKNNSNVDDVIDNGKEHKILANKILLERNEDEISNICIGNELYDKVVVLLDAEEISVLNLIVDGYKRKEICEKLGLNTYRFDRTVDDIKDKCSKTVKRYNK